MELGFGPCATAHHESLEHLSLAGTFTPSSLWTSQSCPEVHPPPLVPILLIRMLRGSALAQGHAQLFPNNLPASPPPAASRMSQLEGTRFIAQEGASQGLWGVGQGSQAVAQKSCLLAGPETHQTRKEGGPGDGPCVHLQSLAHPQDSPEEQQAVTSMVHPLPDRTDSGWPLHPCAFLRPVCLPTQTAPIWASAAHSFTQQTTLKWQLLFYARGIDTFLNKP